VDGETLEETDWYSEGNENLKEIHDKLGLEEEE
jgi:hypothetical protein